MKGEYGYIALLSDDVLTKRYNAQFDKINKISSKVEIYNNKVPKDLKDGLKRERELGNAIEEEMYKRRLITYWHSNFYFV